MARSDKLKEHYRTQVLWNEKGEPISLQSNDYQRAKTQKQNHTKYFFVHGYNKINMPALKSPANTPSFTFSATKRSKSSNENAVLPPLCKQEAEIQMDEIPEDIEMVPPMELETANINTSNVSSTLPEPQMEGHNHSDNDMSI